MKNPAFWRAIHSLAHPVSLNAVLALLLNDHVLRIHSPSWLTGKLGDFAWLVFAPFICAAALAWLVRSRQQEKVVGVLAFAFIGVWFALAKTTPLVHGWTLDALEVVIGYRASLRIDPSDLITLPALLIGWHIWRSVHNTPQTLKSRAWVLLALGTFATVANSPAPLPIPDLGITCVSQSEQGLVAHSANATFTSRDGGLTWLQNYRVVDPSVFSLERIGANCLRWTDAVTYADVDGQSFRFQRGISIDSYAANEQTWIPKFDLSSLNSDTFYLYHRTNYETDPLTVFTYESGPFGAVVDARTDNLVVAMGHDGVLVRIPSGDWQWVSVGQYHYPDFSQSRFALSAVGYDIFTAVFLLVLAPVTLYRPRYEEDGVGCWVMICWLAWFALLIVSPPSQGNDRVGLAVVAAAIMCGCVALICSIFAMIHMFKRRPIALLPLIITSFLAAILFITPFVLWVRMIIPQHFFASLFGTLLAAATLFAGLLYLSIRYPALYLQKNKAEIAQRLASGELVDDDDDSA